MKNYYEIRGDHVAIFLYRKKTEETFETLIDIDDFKKVNSIRGTWFTEYCVDTDQYYARSNIGFNGQQKTLKMHRFIMDCPKGFQVDHINHDTLDNRRSNLRIVTHAQNHQNKKNARSDSSTGVKWVSYNKRDKVYVVSYKKNKTRFHVGTFKTLEEASEASSNIEKQRLMELGLVV